MPTLVTIEFTGMEDLMAELERMKQVPQETALSVFYRWGQDTMAEAKMRTPVAGDIEHGMAPGTLRDSGEVVLTQGEEGEGSVQLVLFFGGAAWAYAGIQHENLEYHHTVGQAKFLESAVLDALDDLGQHYQEEFSIGIEEAM
jgi:hypothetical protein